MAEIPPNMSHPHHWQIVDMIKYMEQAPDEVEDE